MWGLPCWLWLVCSLDPGPYFFALPCSLECMWACGGWECWFWNSDFSGISYHLASGCGWPVEDQQEIRGWEAKNPLYLFSFSDLLAMVWQGWALLLCICQRLPLSTLAFFRMCASHGTSVTLFWLLALVRPGAGTGFPLLLVPGCLAIPYWFF